jgi:hypothetical protein
MRALTVEELGFVSGGGTPLAQQREQAAYDRTKSALQEYGMTESQANAFLGAASALIAYTGDLIANPNTTTFARTAAGLRLVSEVGNILKAIGVAGGVAAIILGTLIPIRIDQNS